jgi:hypothetical protein
MTEEEAGDPPPEETDHTGRTAERGDAVPAAEAPVAMDAPSLVPFIESPAHPDAASDQDEIETFVARRRAASGSTQATSRWSGLAARSCDFSRRRRRSLRPSGCLVNLRNLI